MEKIKSAVTISTHHGFLNTDIILRSHAGEIRVTDSLTGSVYTVTAEPTSIRLSAGEHTLTSSVRALGRASKLRSRGSMWRWSHRSQRTTPTTSS